MSVDHGPVASEVGAIRDELRRLILSGEAAVSVRERNQITRKIQDLVLSIRDSTIGRQAVEGLLHDSSARVRLVAAVKTLKWDPVLALPVIKEIVRRDKGMLGFEAGMVVKEYEVGRLDLDWVPKPKTAHQPKSGPQQSQLRPSGAQLDAVVSVHSTTMSGGFLNSLVGSGALFADAVVGYEGIGLPAAADLLRKALAFLPPAQLPADHEERAALIDGLSDVDATRLENLSGQYQDLFPSDDILFDAIESVSESRRS